MSVKCYVNDEDKLLIYPCPSCSLQVTNLIQDIACGIFRHGYNMTTQQPINPHESKANCDMFANDPNVVGCCKPYRIVTKHNVNAGTDINGNGNGNGSVVEYYVENCDYI